MKYLVSYELDWYQGEIKEVGNYIVITKEDVFMITENNFLDCRYIDYINEIENVVAWAKVDEKFIESMKKERKLEW